jgi:hypothetical protein
MQPVDITGLSNAQISRLENDPSRHVQVGANGIGMPVNFGPQARVVGVKNLPKNAAILAKFGDKVFSNSGKLVLKRLPKEEILKRLQRRKGTSRVNLLTQLGEEYVTKFYLSDIINESDMKLETKTELNGACCKFTGISPKKTAEEKRKAREQRKLKQKKEKKERKEKKETKNEKKKDAEME